MVSSTRDVGLAVGPSISLRTSSATYIAASSSNSVRLCSKTICLDLSSAWANTRRISSSVCMCLTGVDTIFEISGRYCLNHVFSMMPSSPIRFFGSTWRHCCSNVLHSADTSGSTSRAADTSVSLRFFIWYNWGTFPWSVNGYLPDTMQYSVTAELQTSAFSESYWTVETLALATSGEIYAAVPTLVLGSYPCQLSFEYPKSQSFNIGTWYL